MLCKCVALIYFLVTGHKAFSGNKLITALKLRNIDVFDIQIPS